jgi:hypothetical protein
MPDLYWDAYELYARCPLQYSWDRVTPKDKPSTNKRDTQHLVRGNATQSIIEAIYTNPAFWSDPDPLQYAHHCLQREIIDTIHRETLALQNVGYPRCDTLKIANEVTEAIKKTIPTLYYHIRNLTGGVPPKVESQVEHWAQGPHNFTLRCRNDLLVYDQQERRFLYEGKATRYPTRTTDDQVRWQAQILYDSYRQNNDPCTVPPADEHYYIFYATGQVKTIQISHNRQLNPTQLRWIHKRDEILHQLTRGDWTPQQGSNGLPGTPCRDSTQSHVSPWTIK